MQLSLCERCLLEERWYFNSVCWAAHHTLPRKLWVPHSWRNPRPWVGSVSWWGAPSTRQGVGVGGFGVLSNPTMQ